MTMKDWMPGWLTLLKNNKILVCKSSTYVASLSRSVSLDQCFVLINRFLNV